MGKVGRQKKLERRDNQLSRLMRNNPYALVDAELRRAATQLSQRGGTRAKNLKSGEPVTDSGVKSISAGGESHSSAE